MNEVWRRAQTALLWLSIAAFAPALYAADTAKWERFEVSLQSSVNYTNAPQQAQLEAVFTSPGGKTAKVYGFWDGKSVWRVRFSPNETGKWTYKTSCSDKSNTGLHDKKGEFTCTAANSQTRFGQHGPVRVAPDGRYFAHEDGQAFFWLADTAWNGALLSTKDEWDQYIRERTRQKFTAVQWVATQFRAAPKGNKDNEPAYTGPTNRIVINPEFFQKLDAKNDALNKAGLLSVPVMLWAIDGGSTPQVNPGVSLAEDQAILLARYMLARWGANHVAWFLGGDGDYRGPKAEKWRRIGRAVFADVPHAPVTMHPGGMHWVWNEFKDERWYDFFGFQSGHGDDDKTLRWLTEGPPAEDWPKFPHKPFVNLEPPYENHIAYQSKKPITADVARRAIYWSLLNTPTAGVTYGGHGVWGWDDGKGPPTDHPNTGTPLPWQKALTMPGAEQMKYLHDFFTTNDFWRLRPTPVFVVNNPGKNEAKRFVSAARSDMKDIMVVYVPEDRTIEVNLNSLPPSPNISWINPRNGESSPAVAVVTTDTIQLPTPSEGDWLLLIRSGKPASK